MVPLTYFTCAATTKEPHGIEQSLSNAGQKEMFTGLGNAHNADPFQQQKGQPAECYCEPDTGRFVKFSYKYILK